MNDYPRADELSDSHGELEDNYERMRAEIEEWRATQQSLLRSEGKRWATIRELRAQNDQLRELIQRTVVHVIYAGLPILPPEMIAEFREVLTAMENKS